jgi:hypothetical protein
MRKARDPDARRLLNDSQRPQLGASDTRALFNLLEVGFHGLENLTKLPQNPGRRSEMAIGRCRIR